MMTRHFLTATAWLAGAMMLLPPACGGKLELGAFPRIEVRVDDQASSADITVGLPTQAVLDVIKRVDIINPGNAPLTVESIDWARDPDTDVRLKNQHVEIDWQGAIGPNSFPFEVREGGGNPLSFSIRFVPPQKFGQPLLDLSDSVLVIRSNARTSDGNARIAEVRITFTFQQEIAIPRVDPSGYVFTNASLARPERQDFRIVNGDGATKSFRVLDVRLESPSQEFRLLGVPSAGATVLEPNNPGYQAIPFTVEYQPLDDLPKTNAILVETDVTAGGILRVPLSTSLVTGSYSLSYSSPSAFDFTTVFQPETRSVIISSDGPGPITIRTPRIEPEEARGDFSFVGYIPSTTPEGQDTEITGWPRGLDVGRTIRIDVRFQPANDGSDTANGQLIIPYDSPDPGTIVLDLFSGQPKSKLVVAPITDNVYVTGDVTAGQTGTRKIVLYNEGNGPLVLVHGETKSTFGAAQIYSLAGPFDTTSVPVGGVRVIDVAYDLSAVGSTTSTVSEFFELTYYNDFTGQNETRTVGLLAAHHQGLTLPTADPGTSAQYAGMTAGESITLNGGGSTPGGGTFDANQRPYVWYLTAKPGGSMARLNAQTNGPVATFVPDVPGDYTIELVVFSSSGGTLLYSAPASVTITVDPS